MIRSLKNLCGIHKKCLFCYKDMLYKFTDGNISKFFYEYLSDFGKLQYLYANDGSIINLDGTIEGNFVPTKVKKICKTCKFSINCELGSDLKKINDYVISIEMTLNPNQSFKFFEENLEQFFEYNGFIRRSECYIDLPNLSTSDLRMNLKDKFMRTFDIQKPNNKYY